ncbi:EEF1A lysine methyltransferase 2 isoform X1 [Phymastichus coffea]|uniref:EEF1A lysine methyltransferase 2 isoform X1 n=1 Tax=Phymastichus coffea TaxID=108790 RepID=UPI00273C6C6A|nr:EEF1A lysine methyltransferase 2 isoform X1 [Phymastichus coffea]
MSENSNEELPSSELGTREYWDKAYSLEIENYKDHGDVGEIWFGEESGTKVVRYIEDNLKLFKEDDRIMDLGCGNGMLLLSLARKGFRKLTGIDYSQKAIDLAREVLDNENYFEVELLAGDIVDSAVLGLSIFKFKLAHDKGTYDAISLNQDNPKEKRQKYIENVHNILLDDSYLILTSCNWTKDEIIEHFTNYFEFKEEIPSKKFLFGGQTGNTITQLIFTKIVREQQCA